MDLLHVKLDIHAYAEGQLRDYYFDQPPYCGILSPGIMLPLRDMRNKTIRFQYDNNTVVGDLISFVKESIWGDIDFLGSSPEFAFSVGSDRYYPCNYYANLSELLQNYLDPDNEGIITYTILVCHDAGEVGYVHPLYFYVNSRESGRHHEAHIHVRDRSHGHEASVRISDGEIIAGELPSKLAKLAKEKILSEQIYFYKCWNTMTDGLAVDIDKHYGYIPY